MNEVRPDRLCIIIKKKAKVNRHEEENMQESSAVRLIEGIFCSITKPLLHIFSD